MKKKTIRYAVGHTILGLTLLFGTALAWNARTAIDREIARQDEAAKPAEIELTLIAPASCDQCIPGDLLLKEIEKQSVRILASETFLADSQEGTALIKAYGIKRLPTILVKGEYNKENVQESLAKLGGAEKDGTLVIQIAQPVYVDVASNEAIGLVDVTYLTDSSCSDCYDPTQHETILKKNFGVTIQSEQRVDAQSSKGRALIEQYAISQTPTIILSSHAGAYGGLVQTWKKVGTIENDGVFVFRQNTALGAVVYKDLTTGTIIRPETPNT